MEYRAKFTFLRSMVSDLPYYPNVLPSDHKEGVWHGGKMPTYKRKTARVQNPASPLVGPTVSDC